MKDRNLKKRTIPIIRKKAKFFLKITLKGVGSHRNLEPQDTTEVAEDGAEEDHKVDWSTIKVFVKSRPKTLDADAKLSEAYGRQRGN